MSVRTAVAKRAEIPAGGMKIVSVGELRVALCEVEGKLYAIEDLCTHDDGPLGEGTLSGCEVECPRHGARFDARTGEATRMPAVSPARTFPVTVEGDAVLVEVP